jgi:hypothetical protein
MYFSTRSHQFLIKFGAVFTLSTVRLICGVSHNLRWNCEHNSLKLEIIADKLTPSFQVSNVTNGPAEGERLPSEDV